MYSSVWINIWIKIQQRFCCVCYFLNEAMLIVSFQNKQLSWNLAVLFECCHWNDLRYKITANCPPERAVGKFYSNSCWKQLFRYLIMKIIGTDRSGTIFPWPKKIVGSSIIKGQMDIPKKAFLFISLI